jgi:hypothetical protein
MTIETLRFLRGLVGRQQISADTPDLAALAGLIVQVRSELDQAIKEAQ